MVDGRGAPFAEVRACARHTATGAGSGMPRTALRTSMLWRTRFHQPQPAETNRFRTSEPLVSDQDRSKTAGFEIQEADRAVQEADGHLT